jgi:hypothetical protein
MASRPSDSAVIALLAAFLTWVGAWYMGVAAALAFLLDARLPPPHRPQAYVSVAMILVVASYLVTSAPGLGLAPGFGSGGAMWAATLIPVLGTLTMVPLIAASGDIRSFGDVGGERLEARRVRAAQILALVIGWGAVLTLGWAGLTAMLPLWAAIFGAGLWSVQSRGADRAARAAASARGEADDAEPVGTSPEPAGGEPDDAEPSDVP